MCTAHNKWQSSWMSLTRQQTHVTFKLSFPQCNASWMERVCWMLNWLPIFQNIFVPNLVRKICSVMTKHHTNTNNINNIGASETIKYPLCTHTWKWMNEKKNTQNKHTIKWKKQQRRTSYRWYRHYFITAHRTFNCSTVQSVWQVMRSSTANEKHK